MDKAFIEELLGPGEAAEALWEAHSRVVGDYEGKLRSQAAQAAVRYAATAAGGRNLTAIRALLDEAALAEAQDVDAAAAAAVAAVRQANPYLFALPQVTAPGTGTGVSGGGYTMEELGRLSMDQYRAYRMGR